MTTTSLTPATTSLTAPQDREPNARPSPPIPLSEPEVKDAVQANVDTAFIDKFPRLDKFYADPIYNEQLYCIHSFVPAKGASPDSQGCFGFMKCRGTFQTQEQAAARAEQIIRHVDSYHPLQTAYVGRPFPLAVDSRKYAKEVSEIDIKKKTTEVMSEDIKAKRKDDEQVIKDIKVREEKLLAEGKEDFEPHPEDKYAMLLQKRAQLIFTYINTMKRIDNEVKPSLIRTRAELAEMDAGDASLRQKAYERYMNARKESGLDEEKMMEGDNFTKFLMEDVDLGF